MANPSASERPAAARPAAGAPSARSLSRRLAAHLDRSGLLPPEQPVVVALSGGLDSVVLLHLLKFSAHHRSLAAAHFDHGMRPNSAEDAAWVAGLCRAWEVPLVTGRARAHLRSEAEARRARYEFLEAAAPADALIATAHHLDDQAETVLFRAARGSGLRGLAAILPRRGRIVRPLLPFARAELEAYARAARLRWRDDPTNRSAAYARNRIRADVLPALERAVPGARRALARLAGHARAAEGAWDGLLDELVSSVLLRHHERSVEVARERLLAYPSEVQGRILRHLLRRHGFAPGRAGTEAAVEFITSGASGSRRALTGGVELEREFERIVVRWGSVAAPPADRTVTIEGAVTGAGEAVLSGARWLVRWEAGPAAVREAGSSVEAFDPTAVRFPLELRGWRPGDRIRLAGGTKKLKKLFAERRVARGARPCRPILVDAAGRVLWIVDLARSTVGQPVAGLSALQITVINGGR